MVNLLQVKFAVVDIETTGGSARNERIIEIAVLVTDGKTILETFQTLINPEKYIPPYITSITGIDNSMVEGAPTFAEVAAQVDAITKDRVFVAHSVNFDFSFVKREFQLLGHHYDRKKLCTVRLSRKILPGFRSYSLGNLCNEVGIRITDRHRAFGDAQATTILMNMLIEKDINNYILESLKKSSKEAKLPPNVPKESYDKLPDVPGVYYFLDAKGKIIYVGKAKNLKKRVASHFTVSGSSGEKQNFLNKIYDIDFVETGNELIALLLESQEIKKHWPEYNRSQKVPSFAYGLYVYNDHHGYMRFTLSKIQKGWKPVMHFATVGQGKETLYEMVRTFRLCAKLCGLQPAKEACFDHKTGNCDGACVGKVPVAVYNALVERALGTKQEQLQSFAIFGAGRKYGEKSVVLVENGVYQGFGYVDRDDSISYKEQLFERISLQRETPEIRTIIHSFSSGKSGYELVRL